MRLILSAALLLSLTTVAARADDPTKVTLSVTNHVFSPPELHVPAGKPAVITFTNNDATAEEFDSDDLHTEKVAAAHHTVMVRVPPQKPGRYKFEGEYHDKTAQGVLIAE